MILYLGFKVQRIRPQMSSELDKDEKNTTSSFLGITYSEFDNIVGPTIRYCYPPAILATVDLESSYSDYAIVGKHLYMKTIAIRTNKVLFMNCCTAIDNSKYHRNTLLFSFGFILDREADIAPYETSLKKITSAFVAAEVIYVEPTPVPCLGFSLLFR